MCLVALALDHRPRFPLVIAANRDEYTGRDAEPLDWWTPPATTTAVLAGRDVAAGGTWLGLAPNGRLALLTNVRSTEAFDPAAPSRGGLVTDWLTTAEDAAAFCARVAQRHRNGFNLIAADVARGRWFWTSNRSDTPQALGPGIHGLSNASLDTPWPKVVTLKQRLADALDASRSVDALAASLFRALADRAEADAATLPDTGVPPDVERRLSSAFVDMPERGYRTRCSTVLITERRAGERDRTHVYERTFDAAIDANGAAPTRWRRAGLDGWPHADGIGEVVACGDLDSSDGFGPCDGIGVRVDPPRAPTGPS